MLYFMIIYHSCIYQMGDYSIAVLGHTTLLAGTTYSQAERRMYQTMSNLAEDSKCVIIDGIIK